jgi:hypothetical protein
MGLLLNKIRSGWNFQGWVALMKNSDDKNFSSISRTILEKQLPNGQFRASRKMDITRPWGELQNSGWFQIKANTYMQLLLGQNFEIRFRSFFISNLMSLGLKKLTPTLLNLIFLRPGNKYKKSGRAKIYSHLKLQNKKKYRFYLESYERYFNFSDKKSYFEKNDK